MRNGSERVVTSSREHIYDLRSLENYTHVDEFGKDQGINVRHKVKDLIDFIQDDDKLREERKKAKKNKDKYTGISSEVASFRGIAFGKQRSSAEWSGNKSEKPAWKPSPNQFSDRSGENDPNYDGYKSRSKNFDDEYDGEIEDSDTETNKQNPIPPISKFKDPEPPLQIPPVDKKVSINLNVTRPSPSKQPKPIKKIDLGAAASFGKDDLISPSNNNNNLFDDISVDVKSPVDDFDPRAGESNNEFGDFTAAFGGETPKVESKPVDEFADFSSAFVNVENEKGNEIFKTTIVPNLLDSTDSFTSSEQPDFISDLNSLAPIATPTTQNAFYNQNILTDNSTNLFDDYSSGEYFLRFSF